MFKMLLSLWLLFSIAGMFPQGNTDPPIVDNITDSFTLFANPGPSNNGGSAGWAMFLNLIAGPNTITITHMTTGSTAAANASFSVEIFRRSGNALGGPVGSGPGSSPDGWTSLGVVPVTQGSTSSGVSLLFAIPNITINAHDTAGIAMKFTSAGPRYFGSGTSPYGTYADANLTLITGDGRSAPFTTTGTFFASRELVGEIHYETAPVPVELISFTASEIQLKGKNGIELKWITATELNNSGFQIERKTVSADWNNVGFVSGHGSTTETHLYSFVERDLNPGSYSYRLKQIDLSGSFEYSKVVDVEVTKLPLAFGLEQNYPNPFNPSTIIKYSIQNPVNVELKVINLLGSEVKTIVNAFQEAGNYEVKFDGSDLGTGIYFYIIKAGSFTQTRKMLLIK